MTVRIQLGNLADPHLAEFLTEHVAEMLTTAPKESCHVLDVTELNVPEITVLTAYLDDQLVGCGALHRLDEESAELKSMRTAPSARGQGVARAVLTALEDLARGEGRHTMYLETGAQDFFISARRFYARAGYVERPPFAYYQPDPLSVFMWKSLAS